MDEALARLRWRCRRGLLELDLVFAAYVERELPRGTDAERASFEQLLQHPDAELLAWLRGEQEPMDARARALMTRLRGLVVTR